MIATKLDAMHPTCAVCNKPVDSLVWYDDPFKRVRHYIAKCHGDTETTDIHISDLAAMTSLDAISAGTAFRPIDRARITLEAAGHAVVKEV